MVDIHDLLVHYREIDLNEPLCWSTIAHATCHSPHVASEDSVALAAPHDLTSAALVTHHTEVWWLLFVDSLVVMWIMTSVRFDRGHTRLILKAALPSVRGS